MAAKKQKKVVSEALKAKCTQAAEARASVESGTLDGRHKLGSIVKDVMDDEVTYGTRDLAMKELAKAAGYKKDVLYDAAKVVRVWTVEDVKGICSHAPHMSWNHFVELAEIADEQERNEWLIRSVEEKLSVRKLKLRGQKAVKPSPVVATITALTKAQKALTTAEARIESSWDSQLSVDEHHQVREGLWAVTKRLNQLHDRVKFGKYLRQAEADVVGTFQQESAA